MGFFDKIKAGLTRTKENIGHSLDGLFAGELDDDFYDELEETLILGDMGVETTLKAVEELRARVKAEKIKTTQEARLCLRRILVEMISVGQPGLELTTSPAVEIVRQHEGADPAAVVFDAISAAKARKADVILIDTAGRLHNKQNLMNELNKISRVVDRELPGCQRETLLVLDATTGQNGLIQAKQFKEAAGITGIVLTKLDGSAKGGIVIAIADALQVPVKFIGVGEGIDDLMPFEPEAFVEALI